MLDWLEKLWSRGQAFKDGLAITLSGEEKYIIEGYMAAREGIDVNPYTSPYDNGAKKAEWWLQGWLNYYTDSST